MSQIRHLPRWLAAFLCVALIASACADDDDAEPAPSTTSSTIEDGCSSAADPLSFFKASSPLPLPISVSLSPGTPGGYLPPMNDELWTIDDVSDFLKVPKATLYNWNHLRVGPRPLKVGGHCVGGRRRSSTG